LKQKKHLGSSLYVVQISPARFSHSSYKLTYQFLELKVVSIRKEIVSVGRESQ
jgi:hypothetical protein